MVTHDTMPPPPAEATLPCAAFPVDPTEPGDLEDWRDPWGLGSEIDAPAVGVDDAAPLQDEGEP
jgi:hypothetical protein